MIISRTPFRISFFGGGTDYPAWYREEKGAVLSVSINKYCFITCRYLPPFLHYKFLVRYYRREEAQSIAEIPDDLTALGGRHLSPLEEGLLGPYRTVR